LFAKTEGDLSISVLNDGPLAMIYSRKVILLHSLDLGWWFLPFSSNLHLFFEHLILTSGYEEEEPIFLRKEHDVILGCDTAFSTPKSVLPNRAGLATVFCSISGLLHLEVALPRKTYA